MPPSVPVGANITATKHRVQSVGELQWNCWIPRKRSTVIRKMRAGVAGAPLPSPALGVVALDIFFSLNCSSAVGEFRIAVACYPQDGNKIRCTTAD